MTVHTESGGDLARLRIDRDAPARRRWVPWLVLLLSIAIVAAVYPSARSYVAERRAPEVDVVRATQVVPSAGGSTARPVLVATGYVVARHSSDVGVKVGGRLSRIAFEEGTRVRRGAVIAEIEHADTDAQLEAARRAVAESEAQLAQMIAARDEDARNVERQRALARDGITTTQALTAAESALAVSQARVKSSEAAIASARARVRVAEEALENTNVRAPFNGVVIKKRAEMGETVSPFGVAGQASREGGAIATIADLAELEVQTEVSENSVAKLLPAMSAEVKLNAYQDRVYRGRLRQIFPSADRAKAIVEVRVSILDADEHVKPEMTASVTFQEVGESSGSGGSGRAGRAGGAGTAGEAGKAGEPGRAGALDPGGPPIVLVSKRAIADRNGQPVVWVMSAGRTERRAVTLGPDRLDQVEIKSGLVPGEAVIVNPPATLNDGAVVRVKGS